MSRTDSMALSGRPSSLTADVAVETTRRRQANAPLLVFAGLSLCTFVVTAVTPPLAYAVSLVGHLAFAIAIGFCLKRHLTASFGGRLPVTGRAVFVTGCDTGLGQVIALGLQQKGFVVFAGCLDLTSEGSRNLMSHSITVLHVDYLKHNTLVRAYEDVKERLNGKSLWGVVANAGVACYGEMEWIPFKEMQRVIDINILGTLKFVMLGLPQIKKSNGRIVFVTGLQGRVAIPGMVIGSATTAALCHYADGLRREMAKFNVQVCTIEPAFYKTQMTDPTEVTQALNEVTRRLPNVVQEEYGAAYLDSFKFTFAKRLRRFSRQNFQEVSTAVAHALLSSETNVRYCCSGMRQSLTWAVLEFLPLKICDFFLILQFAPRVALAGNIRVRNVIVQPLPTDDTALTGSDNKPQDHMETVQPTLQTPPIFKPNYHL
ncbi:retinol dehydrogenase 5-like [Dermacentor andersoni]|uniref:retinol dehydrogenase 5-like n=1 Tax=Dermacentor andersoni TaxID=34620 RepID=UPI002415B394|nr:retinol dehydrogenase 5-like [Dermacentor andersoni]